jgi:hypothetical protein
MSLQSSNDCKLNIMHAGLRRWLCRVSCLTLLVISSGCFEKTYTDRMNTTVKFYEHKDKLNRNLSMEWAGTGYKLRVPLGFEFIPPPEPKQPDPNDPMPPAEKKPEPTEELNDPRQPEFLGFRLPGLIAAWQKDVNVDEANGSVVKKAHFYLLSNAPLFSVSPDAPGRIEPVKFHETMSNLLSADIMTPIKEDDWRVEEYPAGDFNLVPKVKYRVAMLSPMRLFEETKMTFRVFIHAEGATQTMLLLIYPTETSSIEKLTDRFNYCVETLKAPADPQQAIAPAGGGAGGGPSL